MLLGAVVAAAIAVTGCASSSSSSNTTSGSGNTVGRTAALRIAYPVAQSLDPRDSHDGAQMLISTWPAYDRLIQISARSTYEPMLARSWTFSEGGKSLTLKLRKAVTFSDGTPFDAAAVKANIDWEKRATGTVLAATVADIASVHIVDAHTVKLELTTPSTAVLSDLAAAVGGAMISPKALGRKDLGTHPVGTGAYVVTSFKPGQQVTYERRTDKGGIWDPQTGGPATVTITTMDPDAALNALKSGQVDLATWSRDLATIKTALDQRQIAYTPLTGVQNMVGMYFNRSMKPFGDPLVRRAINYAIDRNSIVRSFTPPGTSVRVQPWGDGLPGFDKSRESAYGYNQAKAKQLLRAAGYGNGVDAGEMLVPQIGGIPQAAEAVQANLASVGIKITLRTMDVYSLVSRWASGKSASSIYYLSLSSIDPSAWLQRLFLTPLWTPGGADPEMAKLIVGTGDPGLSQAQRAARASQAVRYATDQALYAPIWQGVGGVVSNPRVRNLDPLASVSGGVGDFRDVYLSSNSH